MKKETAMNVSETAKAYIDIINVVLAEHTKLVFGDGTKGPTDVQMQITNSYKEWMTRAGDDVQFIESLGNEHFLEGKDAVQHLVLLSVHIVKQMLAKGVESRVAIGLLPAEFASRIHYLYWNMYT